MTTTTAVEAARLLRNRAVFRLADQRFPGITNVRLRPVEGESPTAEAYIGEWCGVLVEIVPYGGDDEPAKAFFFLVALCACCEKYVYVAPADGLSDLSADPPTLVKACRFCKYRARRRAAAERATSRWSAFWFKVTWKVTREDALTGHRCS